MSGSGYRGPRPEPPVKIIKPDGATHIVSANEFRNRAAEAADTIPAPTMTPDGAVTLELLEEMTMLTLFRNMRDAEKLSERTAAATAAVKFIAIKLRIGPIFGEGLDDPD